MKEAWSIWSWVKNRKIGAFELVTGALPLELILGSSMRAIILMVLAGIFYLAKMRFGGEFSLQQLRELLGNSDENKPEA